MKNYIVILILFGAFYVQGQATGYLGKKTVVEFDFVGNYVLIPNWIQKKKIYLPRYKNENGSLVESKDKLDFGFELGIQRVITRRFSIGVMAGYDFFNVGLSKEGFGFSYNDTMILGKHEQIDVNGFYIIPTFEFAHKAGNLPMGIVHQVGLGFRSDSPVEKDYLYDYRLNTPGASFDPNDLQLYNFAHKRYTSIPIFYSVKFRYPLNDYLFLNAGMRYIVSFQKNSTPPESYYSEEGYIHSFYNMETTINSRRRVSMMKGFIGLSLVF